MNVIVSVISNVSSKLVLGWVNASKKEADLLSELWTINQTSCTIWIVFRSFTFHWSKVKANTNTSTKVKCSHKEFSEYLGGIHEMKCIRHLFRHSREAGQVG